MVILNYIVCHSFLKNYIFKVNTIHAQTLFTSPKYVLNRGAPTYLLEHCRFHVEYLPLTFQYFVGNLGT